LRTFKTSSEKEKATVESVDFSPNGSHIMSYMDDGEWGTLAELWDINGNKTLEFHCRLHQAIAFLPACPAALFRPAEIRSSWMLW
jgi:WD40 repeat protein